jgi:cytochrome c-type biogenesis protein CcmH/NrfF
MRLTLTSRPGAPPFFTKNVKKGGKVIPSRAIQAAQAVALAVAICFTLGATDAGSRFNDLGHRMVCPCGCAQLLGECNHVGCPDSDHMRSELAGFIRDGKADNAILTAFSAEYGPTVLAAPTTQGFDLVAWIAPIAVFLAAVFGTILVARHWAATRPQLAQAAPETPEISALREKIRRETGADGGF